MPVTTLLLTPPHGRRSGRSTTAHDGTESIAAQLVLTEWIPLVPRVFDRIVWCGRVSDEGFGPGLLGSRAGSPDPDSEIVEFMDLPDGLFPEGTETEVDDFRLIDHAVTVSNAFTSGRFVKVTAFRPFPGIPRLLSRLAPDCVAAVDAHLPDGAGNGPRPTDVTVFDTAWYREHVLGRWDTWATQRPGRSAGAFLRETLATHAGDPRVVLRFPVSPTATLRSPLRRGLASLVHRTAEVVVGGSPQRWARL